MRIVKIHNTLYRIYTNDRKVKDVWVKDGKIQDAKSDYDVLTEREIAFVKMKIKNENKK